MGHDGWGPTRVGNPAKRITDQGVVAGIDRRQRQDDRSVRIDASAVEWDLGKIGTYEEFGPISVATAAELPFTLPVRGQEYCTTATAFAVSGVPSDATIVCFLDPQSLGASRGRRTDRQESGAIRCSDTGRTVGGTEATFVFGWNAASPPGPLDFFVEIISTPL